MGGEWAWVRREGGREEHGTAVGSGGVVGTGGELGGCLMWYQGARRSQVDFLRPLRPLVQHLEKRMLAVGANIAPECRDRLVLRRLTVTANRFAVGLHLELLQIGRHASQGLGVGHDDL